MSMKLGMEQYVLKLYKFYINDDPELTLIHFKTMSTLANFFCTHSRPRYQVSVYRAIGPLVQYLVWFVLQNGPDIHVPYHGEQDFI